MEYAGYHPVLTAQDKAFPFYVTTVGASYREQGIARPEGMADYQILYTLSGEGEADVGAGRMKLPPNTGIFLPPFTPHSYHPLTGPWINSWITFNGNAVAQILSGEPSFFKVIHPQRLGTLFRDIFFAGRDGRWSETCTVLLYRLLLEWKNCIATDAAFSIYDIRNHLKPSVEYILQSFTRQISLDDLAGLCGVSGSHYCRLFKTAYGVRPFEYITNLRLGYAKDLLAAQNTLSVSKISEMAGYSSPSYFSLLFRRQEGMSPLSFRELHSRGR